MGLNDTAEKLKQAYDWLATEELGSRQYVAAFEFLGGTDIANFTQHVHLEHLLGARCDVTTITLARMGREMAWHLAEQGFVPLALPRHEITEHDSQWRDDPFSGLAVFRMFVPYRKAA